MENRAVCGFVPGDDDAFFGPMQLRLLTAQRELFFLLNQGYPTQSAARFVGAHHQLSARQILALTRTTASAIDLRRREEKRIDASDLHGKTLFIDGFNVIITLEVALCGGMLFAAPDGVIRDLAGLHGTYRLIPQTSRVFELLREAFLRLNIAKAVIFLDAPVSNSGKLKTALYEKKWPVPLDVELVASPDAELKKLACVASGDSIILEECTSWFNLVAWMFEHMSSERNAIDIPSVPSEPAELDLSCVASLPKLRRLVRFDVPSKNKSE